MSGNRSQWFQSSKNSEAKTMSESPQQLNSLDCWDYTIELECLQGTADLQLAAELGKTLLERNKELETTIKILQGTVDDQLQEIEYLSKQTIALKEVNDSRLRIYEQLDVSISDLERANHRLVVENATEKKKVKTLTSTIEALETKCEEYQSLIDDLKLENECYKRKAQQLNCETPTRTRTTSYNAAYTAEKDEDEVDHCKTPDLSADRTGQTSCDSPTVPEKSYNENKQDPSLFDEVKAAEIEEAEISDGDIEQISQLMSQLREVRSQCAKDQRRIAELEDQISTYIQQNQALENQLVRLHHKEEEAKSMHEELTTLEEVRQGQLCSRCLRTVDSPRTGDDMSLSLCDEPEDDDTSMTEAVNNCSQQQMFRSSFHMDVQDQNTNNLYMELVEKYEALIEIQKHNQANARNNQKGNCLSLQEELQMSGDFNTTNNTKDTDEESGHGSSLKTEKQNNKTRKVARTPTDFSEAETSSSGFSDETSNKSTQTDGRPGSFLCTIADGEDKFSIYDDASPIESRFRNRPEYRNLFREIFSVLKKAAKNKEEHEELPLLDDHSPTKATPKVPPVTPSNESFPDFPDNLTDDTQSVLSSTVSELSTSQVEPPTVIENLPKPQEIPVTAESTPNKETKPEYVLKPLVRQPLEYIAVSVNVRKRSTSRRKKQFAERADSPATIIVGSPKVTYSNRPSSGRRRREIRNNGLDSENWNGNTLQFWSTNRNSVSSPTPSQKGYDSTFEFKPSTASQDLHKLKNLDMSYAEVLKYPSKKRDMNRAKRK